MNYYKIALNPAFPKQWNLNLSEVEGKFVKDGFVEYLQRGVCSGFKFVKFNRFKNTNGQLDWNNAVANIPVLSQEVWNLLRPLIEQDVLEAVPCSVEGVMGEFLALNLKSIDCLDEKRSDIVWPTPKDVQDWDALKDKMLFGQELHRPMKYRSIWEVAIDSAKASGHHLFRVKDYHSIVIASEQLKQVFEDSGLRGPNFLPTKANEAPHTGTKHVFWLTRLIRWLS